MTRPTKTLVVLPTLGDRLDTFRLSLESVAAQRDEVDLRLVVVLPDTATEARALALEYGAELIDDPRRGKLAGAMNEGIAARRDEDYYCGLGDDDLLRPGSIAHLDALMQSTPGAVVAYGACDYIDEQGRTLWVSRAGQWAARILPWGPNLLPHPGTLISLDALAKVGGFPEDRPLSMDLDAFLKLKKVGRFASTMRSVAAFRWHGDSMTVANRADSNREARKVKREHLPAWLRPISPLWSVPVGWAVTIASNRVSARGRK